MLPNLRMRLAPECFRFNRIFDLFFLLGNSFQSNVCAQQNDENAPELPPFEEQFQQVMRKCTPAQLAHLIREEADMTEDVSFYYLKFFSFLDASICTSPRFRAEPVGEGV